VRPLAELERAAKRGRQLKWLIALVSFIAVVGCFDRAEKDDRPASTNNLTHSFQLEFGRGSGWHGLNTIKLDQTGRVILHRLKSEYQQQGIVRTWEVATIQIRQESVAEVLKAIDSNGLMTLNKSYTTNIFDGAQWVLWIKRAGAEKSVYFDNNFPKPITQFAKELDAILAKAGLEKAVWQPVPQHEIRQHEKELWNSIKR
jgi:hypothetical protein